MRQSGSTPDLPPLRAPFDELLAACAVPLGLLRDGAELLPVNAAMVHWLERLGARGGPTAWAALPWRDRRAPEPTAGVQHALLDGSDGAVFVRLTAVPVRDGLLVTVDEADGRAAERLEAARVCAIRPLVPALVHELNNVLHVTTAVAEQLREFGGLDAKRLSDRTHSLVRRTARALRVVRSFAVRRRAALPVVTVGALLQESTDLHRAVCADEDVEWRSDSELDDGAAVRVEPSELLAAHSQLALHAIATLGTAPRELRVRAVRRGAHLGLQVEARGDGASDQGLRRLATEPALGLGTRELPGFTADPDVFSLARLAVVLCGGVVDVEAGGDGVRRMFVGALPVPEAGR